MDLRAVLVAVVIGGVAGWLCSLVLGGGGLLYFIVIGMIGAFVGSFLMSLLGVNINLGNPLITQIATATLGAIVVVLLARLIT
jgi:uncharacterized membrane protein YeaQ/YmgE (transglycosylase-associated protein family)